MRRAIAAVLSAAILLLSGGGPGWAAVVRPVFVESGPASLPVRPGSLALSAPALGSAAVGTGLLVPGAGGLYLPAALDPLARTPAAPVPAAAGLSASAAVRPSPARDVPAAFRPLAPQAAFFEPRTGRVPSAHSTLNGIAAVTAAPAGEASRSSAVEKFSLDRAWDRAPAREGDAAAPVPAVTSAFAAKPSGLRSPRRQAPRRALFATVPGVAAAAAAAQPGWVAWLSQLPGWVWTSASVVGIVAGTGLTAMLVKRVADRVAARTELDPILEAWLVRGAGTVVWTAGIVLALSTMGVSAASLLTSAGVYSLAAGLAVKDSVQNIVSGFILLFNRPFELGDKVKAWGEEGKVLAINSRYTTLDLSEKADAKFDRVLLPNVKLLDEKIYNRSGIRAAAGLGLTLGAWAGKLIPVGIWAAKVGGVVGGAWLLSRAFRWLARRGLQGSDMDAAAQNQVLSMAGLLAWVLGALVLLNILGVSLSALVTSLGVVSVAVAFAMKDFVDNLVGGLMIALYRPFRLGDEVKIGEDEGKVVDITHRYIRLQLKDGGSYRIVNIPNSKLMLEKIYLAPRTQPLPPS
ncbi:MAG TPA: hypothetical protein DD417_18590 [Elusimicrobia bacterium]|nr:hypothetical protein [Elusimicrobiota bacterium]